MQRSLQMMKMGVRYQGKIGLLSPQSATAVTQHPSLLVLRSSAPYAFVGVRHVWRHSQEKRDLKQTKKNKEDPFKVLGLSENVDYATVKQTFMKVAMDHHPDTSKAESEEERERHREIFVAARKAFENIVEGPGGMAVLRSDEENAWEEAELNEWFHQESGGFEMPFMDAKTRKEVSRVMEEMGGGLDRDGGMWTLARMVANENKNGGDAASLLRLEAGNVRDREINGILRRKRRR